MTLYSHFVNRQGIANHCINGLRIQLANTRLLMHWSIHLYKTNKYQIRYVYIICNLARQSGAEHVQQNSVLVTLYFELNTHTHTQTFMHTHADTHPHMREGDRLQYNIGTHVHATHPCSNLYSQLKPSCKCASLPSCIATVCTA